MGGPHAEAIAEIFLRTVGEEVDLKRGEEIETRGGGELKGGPDAGFGGKEFGVGRQELIERAGGK